jgi:hypothetical protein
VTIGQVKFPNFNKFISTVEMIIGEPTPKLDVKTKWNNI